MATRRNDITFRDFDEGNDVSKNTKQMTKTEKDKKKKKKPGEEETDEKSDGIEKKGVEDEKKKKDEDDHVKENVSHPAEQTLSVADTSKMTVGTGDSLTSNQNSDPLKTKDERIQAIVELLQGGSLSPSDVLQQIQTFQASQTSNVSSIITNSILTAEATLAKNSHILQFEQATKRFAGEFIRMVPKLNVKTRVITTYPVVEKIPTMFKLRSIKSSSYNQIDETFLPMPDTTTDSLKTLITKSRELFSNGTMLVEVYFTTEDFITKISNPTIPTTENVFELTFLGSNDSYKVGYELLISKFKAFCELVCNYRFLVSKANFDLVNIPEGDANHGRFANVMNNRVLRDDKPHVLFSCFYNGLRVYTDHVYETLIAPGRQELVPRFNRAQPPRTYQNINLYEYPFSCTDQFSSELAYINFEKRDNDKLDDEVYKAMLVANSTKNIIFKQDSVDLNIFKMIGGYTRQGWNRTLGLVLLDDGIKSELYNMTLETLLARNIFTFRDLSNVMFEISKGSMTSGTLDKATNYIANMKAYCSSTFVCEAITTELLSGFIRPTVFCTSISSQCPLSFTIFGTLLINFLVFPKTFFRSCFRLSNTIYNFFMDNFSQEFNKFLNKVGWLSQYNYEMGRFERYYLGNGPDISLDEYHRGVVPTIFTNRARGAHGIFSIYELIEPQPFVEILDAKRAARYPYCNNDYSVNVYLPYVRGMEVGGVTLNDRIRRINAYIEGLMRIYYKSSKNPISNNLNSTERRVYNTFSSLCLKLGSEVSALCTYTFGVIFRDLYETFPFMLDDFNPVLPALCPRDLCITSHPGAVGYILQRYNKLSDRNSIAYDAILWSCTGIVPRENLSLSNPVVNDVPMRLEISPTVGHKMTEYSSVLYSTAEYVAEVLHISQLMINPNGEQLEAFREYFAQNRFLTNNHYTKLLRDLTDISGVPIDEYFGLMRDGISYNPERRIINPVITFCDYEGTAVNENDLNYFFIDQALWFIDPSYNRVLSLADELIFGVNSPLYSNFSGVVLGIELRDNYTYASTSMAYDICNDRVFDYDQSTTFTKESYDVQAFLTTRAVQLIFSFTIDQRETIVRRPEVDVIEPVIMRVRHYSDIPQNERDFIQPLIKRGMLYVHIVEQFVEFTLKPLCTRATVLYTDAILSEVGRIAGGATLYMELYDTTNVTSNRLNQLAQRGYTTYLLPARDAIDGTILKNVVARNILGEDVRGIDNNSQEGFVGLDPDNWSSGFNDAREGRLGVRMPSNNMPKILAGKVNFNNVVPTITSNVITSPPTFTPDLTCVRL